MDGTDQNDPLPESAMGGASDAGAHGKHPASAARLDPRVARAEDALGDVAIERRYHHDSNYSGPDRRIGGRKSR
jgi:hypothetical protein